MRMPNWLSQPLSPLAPYTPYLVSGTHIGLCLLAPVFLFLAFFNPDVLNVTHIGWTLEADWGQHVNGWNAFRNCADAFNHQTCYAAPIGNTLISTDSNPPFAFLFKPFAHWLPANFQYIGIWFFFCVCMHFVFSYKLVRPHAPGRWSALGGALALSAMPILYYRERHDTLMAQWTILWALHLFINVRDDTLPEIGSLRTFAISWFRNGAKMLGYAALLGFAGLLHPYLLFMVAAVWGGDVLKRFWPAARALDRAVLLDVVARSAFVLAAAVVGLALGGSFTKGMAPGAAGWAYYSMNLMAFFNPVRPEFSAIMRATPLNGGQSFEGYQYLGFGLLTLLVIAFVLFFATSDGRRAKDFFGRLLYLSLPFAALLALAVTNRGLFYGQQLWYFPTPDILKNWLAILRASGRMAWPIAYCMVLAGLAVLFRMKKPVIAFVLPAILALQAYDLNGFASAMRDATALAESSQTYYLTPSPAWDQLVAQAKGVDFYPANIHLNDKLFYELTWRATSEKKPVNTVYAARENLIQVSYEDSGEDQFKEGQVNNDHLFVFLKQCDVPPSLWPRLRMLDGVWIIPPASAGNLDGELAKPRWSPMGSKVRFGWLDQGTCLLDQNWSKPDVEGVWSDGPKAGIVIPIKAVQFDTVKPPRALDLKLTARSRQPVLVTVLVNNIKVGRINLDRQKSDTVLHLPKWVLRRDNLNIRFVVAGDNSILPPPPPPPAPANVTGRGAVVTPVLVAAQPDAAAQALGIKLVGMTLVDRDAPPPLPAAKPATGA